MNHPAALRLTPSNSPFFRASTPRSPTKGRRQELGLQLKQIIGTTASSANGFDSLPSRRWIAFTAGAAAVLATVDEDLKITQRFFRARPTASPSSRDAIPYASPTPGASEARHRALNNIRDFGNGQSPLSSSARDWSDSPTGKSTTAKDRVKAATSVALSPNGKWFAIGETGYRPRVLVFSTAKDGSTDSPVAALSEHTFGIHALAFSSDSKYLASLGTVNDGFLYIWTIDDRTGSATLHASNKCTSLVRRIAWMGRTLVTGGLRFVKVWRPDEEASSEGGRSTDFGSSITSPRHKTLAGRNSLLGPMIDANFCAVLPVSSTKAIICAESGEICLLDDSAKTQSFATACNAGFRISSAALDCDGKLHVTGASGNTRTFIVDDLEHAIGTLASPTESEVLAKDGVPNTATAVAMAMLEDVMVTLDSKRALKLSKRGLDKCGEFSVQTHQLQAHEEPVVGVKVIDGNEDHGRALLTFSGNGTVLFWSADGSSRGSVTVPISSTPDMYGLTNELKSVAPLRKSSLLAVGDRYGTLSILNTSTGVVASCARAHSAEVTDIAVCESEAAVLLATASRDRTLQLFAWHNGSLDLLQTLDEHAGAVTGLLFAKAGQQLLSYSADRTVVVREAVTRTEGNPLSVAYLIARTVTLKGSPTSVCLTPDEDTILVSAVDRTISKLNTKNGQVGFSFKCSDAEGGETAVMSKIEHIVQGNMPVIAGVSSSDKSIRLYGEFGTLLARDWGHTEGITDFAVLKTTKESTNGLSASPRLVTVAADSTIFIWDTATAEPQFPTGQLNSLADPPAFSPAAGPPLRKVISHSELSRLHQTSKSTDDGERISPTSAATLINPRSPRLRKRASRMSVLQTPILEAPSRSQFADSGRKSVRHRSPSPPSPRNAKLSRIRRPSMGTALRTKSSDNITTLHKDATTNGSMTNTPLTSSTESVCRTLRAFRKKLAASQDALPPEALRELDKELKLTARVVGEKSQGRNLDESMVAKLLDQASEKIVGLLDERIKERVESEVRKSSDGPPLTATAPQLAVAAEFDAVVGALQRSSISD